MAFPLNYHLQPQTNAMPVLMNVAQLDQLKSCGDLLVWSVYLYN